MGIFEWLTGWEYLGNTLSSQNFDVHPNIIKVLNKRINKDIAHQTKRWLRENRGQTPLGRTARGLKNLPNFTGVGYVKGKTFLYKGKETHYFIDNHGHGGAISRGMKIWRKLKRE